MLELGVTLTQCPQEIQIQTDTVVWLRCDLEYKHDSVCQTTVYHAKHHDGRNVRIRPMLIQWSPLELEDGVLEMPQCDFQMRYLRDENMTRCDEPAKFNVRIYNAIERREIALQRCSQHGLQLRNYLRDNDGWTRSGKVRILSVEEIRT